MSYKKPELIVLGNAASLIALTGPNYKTTGWLDGNWFPPHWCCSPAYDLDE